MDPTQPADPHPPSPRIPPAVEAAIEFPAGAGLIAFGAFLLKPAMWWLGARAGFRNSAPDLYNIEAEGHSKLAAAVIALVSGVCLMARAAWLLRARRRTGAADNQPLQRTGG